MTDLGVDDLRRIRQQDTGDESSSGTAKSEAMSRREGRER
jgi:hypothetical protein